MVKMLVARVFCQMHFYGRERGGAIIIQGILALQRFLATK